MEHICLINEYELPGLNVIYVNFVLFCDGVQCYVF